MPLSSDQVAWVAALLFLAALCMFGAVLLPARRRKPPERETKNGELALVFAYIGLFAPVFLAVAAILARGEPGRRARLAIRIVVVATTFWALLLLAAIADAIPA